MPTFRKTALIEAVQWKGDNWEEIKAFCCTDGPNVTLSEDEQTIRVLTREGLSDPLPIGYWVATDGESFWPIADDFMRANYEEVEG